MTWLAWMFLALFLLAYFCGFIISLAAVTRLERVTSKKEFHSMLWQTLLLWIPFTIMGVWELTVSLIAGAKYRKNELRKTEECDCPDFQPKGNGGGAVCQNCGYVIEDGLIPDGATLEDLNKNCHHQVETEQWLKFKTTVWYRWHMRARDDASQVV